MTDFNRSQIFNGTCAPFMYIADCSPTARRAYMDASRFWLAATSLALIALIVAIVRRSLRVKERLNTLRLTVICFTLGAPLHIIYDALRVGDAKQHGVPPHIMSFLWVVGWVPYIIGMLLLVVTWVSFSSKNLLARPALTGNPLLFWGLAIPFIISSVIGSIVCGVNYWWYWVSMRVAVAVWSAFFLIIALFAGYYGNQTLVRLHKTRDSFNYHQQLRILIVVVAMFIACGICLGVQSFFLSRIDEIYQVFLLVTTLYRVCGLIVLVGSSIYVWVATTHTVSHSTRGGSRSERSARRSHAKRSSESGDSTEGRSSEAKSNNADESSQEDAESSSSAESGAQQLEEADDSELPNGKQESEHMLPHDDTSSSSLLDPYADDVAEDASTSSEESIS